MSSAFWSEPLNVWSNLSFLVAAWWGWSAAMARGKLDGVLALLCLLAAAIGVGSFLFHTFATLWASFADVIPIWSFVALYVVVAVIRLTGKSPWRVGGIAAGLMATIVGLVWIMAPGSATQIDVSPDPLNGSAQYAPAIISLWVFAFICLKRSLEIRVWIVSAACVFSLSQSLGQWICSGAQICLTALTCYGTCSMASWSPYYCRDSCG